MSKTKKQKPDRVSQITNQPYTLSELIECALRMERDALASGSESNVTEMHRSWCRGVAQGIRNLRHKLEQLREADAEIVP